MMYLSDCQQSYATNNKLEEGVSQLITAMSRKLIHPDKLEVFKIDIKSSIAALNAAYPKCKPVMIDFEKLNRWPVKNIGREDFDYVIRWNNYPHSNGKHICEFKILASIEEIYGN